MFLSGRIVIRLGPIYTRTKAIWYKRWAEAMKVIIVDDSMVMREALSEALEADGIEVVATAPDAPTALEAAAEYHPDVAIVDLHLPGQDGEKLAAELLDSHLVDYVVMMSVDSSSAARLRASRAGAALFVDKCHDTSRLGRELQALKASASLGPTLKRWEAVTLIARLTPLYQAMR